MSELITASKCVELLKENGVADFKLSYFSKRDAEDISTLSISDLNKKILEQNLRIQTSKADELGNVSIPREKVVESIFASSRVIRDGMMGIAPRLASRIAAVTDPHECRVMIEEEIVRQLSKLEDILHEL